jgi:hypothetical protein
MVRTMSNAPVLLILILVYTDAEYSDYLNHEPSEEITTSDVPKNPLDELGMKKKNCFG